MDELQGTIPADELDPGSGADQNQTATENNADDLTAAQQTTAQPTTGGDTPSATDTLGKSIKHFTDENKTLKQTLQEREAELAELRAQVQYSLVDNTPLAGKGKEVPNDLPTDAFGNVWYDGAFRTPEEYDSLQRIEQLQQRLESLETREEQQKREAAEAQAQAEFEARQREVAENLGKYLESERSASMPFVAADKASYVDEFIANLACKMSQSAIDSGAEFSESLVKGHIKEATQTIKELFGSVGNAQIQANLRGGQIPNNSGEVVLDGQKPVVEMTKEERREFLARRMRGQ